MYARLFAQESFWYIMMIMIWHNGLLSLKTKSKNNVMVSIKIATYPHHFSTYTLTNYKNYWKTLQSQE